MALPREPLTDAEGRRMLKDWRSAAYGGMLSQFIMQAMAEPTPHVVRYRADSGTHYTPPAEFYWGVGRKPGPSDCLWIIPGTLEKRM